MSSLYGVIGNPIKHSKSPLMHNQWFEAEGIDASYHAFTIEPKNLEDAIKGMKALGIKGWNVTIPHKESIIPFLDEIDESAAVIGAVNTVVADGPRLIGKNTDGQGFVESLLTKRTSGEIKKSSILILGAGGAAKGIYHALLKLQPKRLYIANRTVSRAEALIKDVSTHDSAQALTMTAAEENPEQFDIIINTTSVGMSPAIGQSPIKLGLMKKDTLAVDIIYNPLETEFLKRAKAEGADTLNGVGMFVHQGALAFSYWTGSQPDTKKAIKMITENLGGVIC
ncbi:shikimate dehydrogenase [Jeotgalibacillus proteolyticus]|uniref:Shikimate dehydrogenase (NADP(+)) n=1 Tax=Jeotgalibacillus proteolyticus TaxID=2082395 RepID=A0A2S5GEY6_9BACL|nr:shikimate dehydrogenase [Jeotgalibacillus proteolyticus]PPA71481.1 shikimate dehydrogenase [Jeotgalibacillus proteolyticus]